MFDRVADAHPGVDAHYNYYRDYDPSIGRYIESDPMGLWPSLNTYAYLGGKPLERADYRGLEPGTMYQRGYGPLPPNTVFLCQRPAQILGGGVDHFWLKTSIKEAGMGGDPGIAPGQQYESAYATSVYIRDHSQDNAASCRAIDHVNEVCVNNLLQVNTPLGQFMPGLNDCRMFANTVLSSCRTMPR